MRVGDVVRLKSGGPKMTVASAPADSDEGLGCYCDYFNNNGNAKSIWFRLDVLELVGEPQAFDPDTFQLRHGSGPLSSLKGLEASVTYIKRLKASLIYPANVERGPIPEVGQSLLATAHGFEARFNILSVKIRSGTGSSGTGCQIMTADLVSDGAFIWDGSKTLVVQTRIGLMSIGIEEEIQEFGG